MAQRPMDLFDKVLAIANDPWHTRWLCPLLVAGDAVLTAGIVWKVPCMYCFTFLSTVRIPVSALWLHWVVGCLL